MPEEYRMAVGISTDTACAYFRRAEVNYAVGNIELAKSDLAIAAQCLEDARKALDAMHEPVGPVGGKL